MTIKPKNMPTLAEFGKRLPIGMRDEKGELQLKFALREWDWDLEEKIGESIENSDGNAMHHVTHVVAAVTKAIGGVDFDKLNDVQRRGLISRMYYSDVIMLYIWARIEGMGPNLKLETFNCHKCKKPIDFVGDLRHLEVMECDPKNLSRTVSLENGVKYANECRKKVIVEPLTWSFFESDDFVAAIQNPAKLKLLTMQHGVREVEGAPRPAYITREHARTMKVRDVIKIVKEVDQCGGGAVMEIEVACQHCKAKVEKELEWWRYGDFFGQSVQ